MAKARRTRDVIFAILAAFAILLVYAYKVHFR